MPVQTQSTDPTLELDGRGKRQQIKRRQIIDAAASLFIEKGGFADVSMDAVVIAAGVSKRTLYNYYESKEQLFLDAIHKHMETIWLALKPTQTSTEALEDKLKTIGVGILTIGMKPEPMALYRIMVAESQRFPELTRAFYDVSSKRVLLALADMIAEFGPKAGLKTDTPESTAEHYMDLILGAAFMRVVMGIDKPMTPKSIRAHVDQALTRFLAAARATN